MKTMRRFALMALVTVCSANPALAQAANPTPIPVAETDEKAWSFSASAYTYIVPDDGDYVQPAFTADRAGLHLETRYNYEARDTLSAWVGYNFSGGEELAWEFTPMLGGVFGATDGIAPGYRGSLGLGKVEFYSEGEYVFDLGSSSDRFFYNWSELTLAPVVWLRFGLVTQRTRVYKTDREIQRGALVGFLHKGVSLTGYAFNPDDDKPTFVVSVGLTF
jgi:hypothetical protein